MNNKVNSTKMFEISTIHMYFEELSGFSYVTYDRDQMIKFKKYSIDKTFSKCKKIN